MLEWLKVFLKPLAAGGIALAYSGGVDSALLLAVLAEMQKEKNFSLVALTMQTVLYSPAEIKEALDFSAKLNIKNELFTFNPFSVTEVRNNRTDRCYHCKKGIFTRFAGYAAEHRLQHLLDGTNADDLNVYRPGRRALRELGVISPLAELGFTKAQIREMSASLGLKTASKPAAPCLATRFEYNTELTDELIKQAADGENFIRRTFPEIKNFRLRIHCGGKIARLEIERDIFPQVCAKSAEITSALKKLGFSYITLDLEGFRSGSFDTDLGEK